MAKNRIRQLRLQNDVTAAQLSRMIGVTGARLRRWDRGEVNPPFDICQMIAERFKVSRDYVMGEDVSAEEPSQFVLPAKNNLIPLYARRRWESSINVGEGPVDHIEKPLDLLGIDDCYAIMIFDASMEPRFFAGEVVIVHPFRPVRSEDYCVVQYREEDKILAIAKRFLSRDENGIRLSQHNPEKIIVIDDEKLLSIHYIKVIRAI